jgi:enoyl-CoA hydratase/carnithine racemase
LNAVSPDMVDDLRRAAADLGDRDNLRVLIIRARGRYFTAGVDIDQVLAQRLEPDASANGASQRREYRRLHLLFDELESIEKPVVLAAHAPCWGVGVELAASCDFRIASDAATFALPEVANLGIIPGSGGISRVTRLVGPHWGKWLAMAGEVVDAHHALTMGLVHAVHPVELFDEAVARFVHRLSVLPGEAVGMAKLAVDTAASVDRGTARDFDRIANTVLGLTEEHKNLVQSFQDRNRMPPSERSQ